MTGRSPRSGPVRTLGAVPGDRAVPERGRSRRGPDRRQLARPPACWADGELSEFPAEKGTAMTLGLLRVGPARVEVTRRVRRGAVIWSWATTTDHKVIGNLYFVTSMAFFLLGGVLALAMR